MNQTNLQKETDSIIKTYTLIYRIIFRLSTFLIIILASIVLVWFFVIGGISTESKDNTQKLKANIAVKNFEKILNQTIDTKDFDIMFLRGFLGMKGNFIQSVDNLILYKGFVTPNWLLFDKNLPLKNFKELTGNYDIQQLNVFINNIVLTKQGELPRSQNRQIFNFENDDFVTEYELECAYGTLNKNSVCEQKINNFHNNFFVYDLSKSIEQINSYFDAIRSSTVYKNAFCSGLKKYFVYSNNSNQLFFEIARKCDLGDFFETMKGFAAVQDEVNSILNPNVFSSRELNALKLLTFQQRIYQNFSENKQNQTLIATYIDYVRSILKKPLSRLDRVYFDEIFLFNNLFLPNYLVNFTKQEQTKLLQFIRELEIGSKLLGFDGLKSVVSPAAGILISNNSLPQNESISQSGNVSQSGSVDSTTKDRFVDRLNDNPYFSPLDKNVQGNDANIKGIVTVLSDQNQQLNVYMKLNFVDSLVYVENINIAQQDLLTISINDYLKKNKATFGEIYERFILKTSFIAPIRKVEFNLCEQLKQSLFQAKVDKCEPNRFVIITSSASKFEFFNSGAELKDINYYSPEGKKESLKRLLDFKTTQDSVINAVVSTLDYKNSTSISATGLDNKIPLLYSKFEQFMDLVPSDIQLRNGTNYFVKFAVKQSQFIAVVDKDLKSISSIFYVFNDKSVSPMKINGLSFQFDSSNKDKFNSFVLSPLTVIQSVDPLSWSKISKDGQ